ncbi:MAG: helix-turn-helix domain-containing protein [Chlorobi bacterium CHB2]|nr:helix-turn-helix domain-containing protein [Chlorobi bacterium CHB2]
MDSLLTSLENALSDLQEIRAGKKQPSRITYYQIPDAKEIRNKMGMSQAKFALMLGISQRTLEGWEQGRRRPKGPARRLLEVAQNFPEAVASTAFTRQIEKLKNSDGSITTIITYGKTNTPLSSSESFHLSSQSVNEFGTLVVNNSNAMISSKTQKLQSYGQEKLSL